MTPTSANSACAWRPEWRRRPASAAQLARLARRGIAVRAGISRSEARALLRGLPSPTLQPGELVTAPGDCSLCERAHPDKTPAECRRWALHRYAWHAGELARLHALLSTGVTA